MTLLEFLVVAAASWSILAIAGGIGLGRCMKRADDTQRATYPPPVPHPAMTQADIDATWLDPWPQERMPQQQVDRLFDDLIALEGLQ